MKTVTIHATWRSEHTVEVPDDFDPNSSLSDWPEDVADAITSDVAELVDWGDAPSVIAQH